MKICLIMGGDEEGGLETHVVELGNALASSHNVHIIAHAKYEDRFKGVSFHAVDLTKSRRNLLMLLSVRRKILIISPYIIHAHANKAASIISLLKYFLPSQIKYIATLHSLKKRISSYEKFDWVIGVSARSLENLRTPKKSVIYNGVYFDKTRQKQRDYLTNELKLNPDKLIFVSIGRLVEVKRFDILIKAFQNVDDAYLLIVGEGKERAKLENKIADLKLSNIHLLGHRNDNIEILSAADYCVISSEREGFPYVVTESLLVNTPVVSTDVSDMKVILPNQAIVPVNDVQELHRLLASIVEEPDLISAEYCQVFEWASKKLSFNEMVANTEKIYRKLTAN